MFKTINHCLFILSISVFSIEQFKCFNARSHQSLDNLRIKPQVLVAGMCKEVSHFWRKVTYNSVHMCLRSAVANKDVFFLNFGFCHHLQRCVQTHFAFLNDWYVIYFKHICK